MKKIITRAGNFFYKPAAIETLGYFRIGVSAFALVQLFILLPDWMALYGPNGLLPWPLSDALSTSNMPSIADMMKVLSPLNISANGTVYLITIMYFVSLVGLLLGFKTRLMGIVAWFMHLVLNTTGHFTAYGVETFAHISLFYCAVLPVGSTLSIDARRKATTIPPNLITLSIRVIQLHLCLMYFASGIEKALGYQWWNGEAIWIALQQDQFHQFNINWMANVPWVPTLLCWGTLLVETCYPLGMLYSKTRKYWLIGILMMHLGIAIFLGLHLFGGLMIILNASAFAKDCFPKLFSPWEKKWWKYNFKYNINHVGEVFNPS